MRNLNSRTDARIRRILADRPAIMGQPHPSVKCEPACGFELFLEESCFSVGAWHGSRCRKRVRSARWKCVRLVELIIALAERLQSGMKIVAPANHADRGHAASVVRSAIVLRLHRICKTRFVVRMIEVV